ncbi:MAG: lamin tail domain-containing protein, partial [Planctomycetota bacterium]
MMSISVKTLLILLVSIAFSAGPANAETILLGDLDGNYRVDYRDLRFFAWQWLDEDCLSPGCDSDLDNVNGVNMDDLALLAKDWKREELHLVISEIMASNNSEEPLEEGELLDEDGDSSDWIEIYNPMDASVNLEGWSLVYEDDANQAQWYFPYYELGAGQFLVVFASYKNRLDPNELHTNFELNMDGAYLALVASDGNTVIHEFAPYPRQLTDISYGLSQYAKTLVPSGVTATYHVPTSSDAALGKDWADVDFDDSTWDAGKTGLGFGIGGVPMVAYNDCYGGGSTAANVTDWTIHNNNQSHNFGKLKDFVTGSDVGMPSVMFTMGPQGLQVSSSAGVNPAAGTDAYEIFNNIVDLSGYLVYYGSSGWWTEIEFTGLNPASMYSFAGTAIRAKNYPNRKSLFTIMGHTGAVNNSSNGVVSKTDSTTVLLAGDNSITGYVVRWDGIIPAGDGSFKVRAEATTDSEDGKAYPFSGFILEGGFRGTNVEGDMLGVNSSLWMRTEFDLEEGESAIFDSLTLRMKYEDGFVAYLNGEKVAGENAPDPVQWNSTALADRPIENAAVFEIINLTAYVHALQDGRNVLAIHGLNDGVTDPNFLVLPELDAASNMTVPQYFTQATPGKFNVSGAIGIVSDVWFSHDRGFYSVPFQLILSTALDNAEIRYTTDGSRPTITHGTVYSGPIDISSTSTIRAVAVNTGWLDSEVETHTYIFLDDVIGQSPSGEVPPGWPPSGVNGQSMEYGMDFGIVNDPVWGPQLKSALLAIPTMSIVTDLDNLFNPSIGIYVNAGAHGYTWERPTSLELIYPPNPQGPGYPDLVQVPVSGGGTGLGLPADMRGGFQIDAGIRIRGGYSRSDGNPKHAFRLFFRNEYGAGKLRYPLFGDEGVDGFDKVDLRTAQNYSWSYANDSTNTMCREVWARDSQGLMDQAYTRSRYYHLYINGQYWGIFQTQERSEAAYAASYFGGEREEWDCVKSTGPNAGYTIEATDGTLGYWQDLWELTNILPGASGSQRNALYLQMQGLNSDGTRNPGYPVLLDVDNIIDYMIMVFFDGDRDAPISNFLGNTRTNNWYGVRNRNGEEGFRVFVHDAEHIMSRGLSSRIGPFWCGDQFQYSNPQWIHQRLMLVPEYRLRFADHAQKHLLNGGLLTSAEAVERLQARAAQIDMAIIAESARWGNIGLNKNTWLSAVNSEVTGFLPPRAAAIIGQLKTATLIDGGAVAPLYPSVSAPTFNQDGGDVPSGFSLIITASGTIYYTLDGSDPREPFTGNPVGTSYSGQFPLNKSTHVKARALSGGTWSALNEAVFSIGPLAQDLRITEIMYHPKDTGDPNDPNEEFIELKNIGGNTVNLNLVRFTEGIDFTFPDMDLDPNEFVVVVKNEITFEAKYGTAVNVAGQYAGRLANDGERIKLEDAIGRTILDFKYEDGWRSLTDGDGFSLTIIDPTDKALFGSEQGLVAHWKFDDGPGSSIAIDSVGTNNGTLNGDPTWIAGRIEGALSFDGTGDYVFLAPIDPLAGDNFTVQAWVNIDASAGVWNPVMMQHDLSNDGCYFYVANDKPSFYIFAGASFVQAVSLELLDADRWYHVAATNDGANLKMYVDGRLKASASSAGLTGVSFDAYIGCESVSLIYYMGLMDDVRIYNRPVSASEYQNIADPMGRWSRKSSWRASVYRNGTPGWDDSGILPNPGAVVINEVMSHSNDGPDWIELYNTTSESINIGGWFLSDNNRDEPNLMKYRIADGTIIYDNSYLVFYQDTDFNNP